MAPMKRAPAPEGATRVVVRRLGDLLACDPADRLRRLARLTQSECELLLHAWRFWARDSQLPPPGDWVTWLILAGRGAGKTRTGAETVREWATKYSPVNLIGATAADARDVMVLGESGVLACCRPSERPAYARTARASTWPNGAVTLLFSAEEPDRLRGEQHMKLWCDELAAWRYPETFDQALLGLRLGDRPQARRHHDAAADQDHQGPQRRSQRHGDAGLHLRQCAIISPPHS